MIARFLLLALASVLLSGCAGVLDICRDGLADNPPGAPVQR